MPVVLEDEFGDIISKARFGKGLSAEQVAKEVNVSSDEIARMESYGLIPGDETIKFLADLLELDGDKLIDIARGRWTPKKPEGEVKGGISLKRISVGGPYKMNCYVLGCLETKEGVVIDPGDDADMILKAIRAMKLTPKHILITHGHGDHTGALREIRRATSAPALIHREDLPLVASGQIDDFVKEGDEVSFGRLKAEVRHLPGHSMGSVGYVVEGMAFVGDTLFAGSLGRARGTEAFSLLLRSVKDKLFTLDNETTLFPGHGPATMVGEEKEHNPFFR